MRSTGSAVRHRHTLARALGGAIGAVLAVYLLGRGIAEFFTVHYSDPASYRDDWGGPSLAGVFAVHTGPAVVIVTGAVIYLIRRARRTGVRHPLQIGPGSQPASRIADGYPTSLGG